MAAIFSSVGLSVVNSMANSIAKGKKIKGMELLFSSVLGAICGAIGGSGANLKRVTGVISTYRSKLLRAQSPKKIVHYTSTIRNLKIDTVVSSIRYVLSAVAGALGGSKKKYILGVIK